MKKYYRSLEIAVATSVLQVIMNSSY